jgi:hypothetical protein
MVFVAVVDCRSYVLAEEHFANGTIPVEKSREIFKAHPVLGFHFVDVQGNMHDIYT